MSYLVLFVDCTDNMCMYCTDDMIASAYPLPVPLWAASLKFKGMKISRVHLPDF